MKIEYFDQLPSPIKQMVLEIEVAIGREITARDISDDDPDFIQKLQLPACMCKASPTGLYAEIIIPSKEIPTHHLAHEVMHVHRQFVQQITRLSPKIQDGGLFEQIAASIDNDLEHVFIVPAEISTFPEALPVWEADFNKQLVYIESKPHISTMTAIDAALTRLDMIRSYAVAKLILGDAWQSQQEYRNVLRHQGLLSDAENLLKKLHQQNGKKREMILTMLRFSRLPAEWFYLASFDLNSGSERYTKIPTQR